MKLKKERQQIKDLNDLEIKKEDQDLGISSDEDSKKW